MDYKEPLNSVLKTIKTVGDRNVFLQQLDIYHNQLFTTVAKNQVLVKYANLFDEVFSSSTDKVQLINEVKKAVAEMKVIDLIIAFEPRISDIESISMWLKANVSESALMSVVVDPGIVGGSKISIDGLFKDNSVHSKLDSYWKSEGLTWFKTLGIAL